MVCCCDIVIALKSAQFLSKLLICCSRIEMCVWKLIRIVLQYAPTIHHVSNSPTNKYHFRFSLSEVKLGMVPATISPYVIRKIGYSQSKKMFVLGSPINGDVAKQINLVHFIAENENELQKYLETSLKNLQLCSPNAVARAKQLCDEVQPIDYKTIQMSVDLLSEIRKSKDVGIGVSALLNREQPAWAKDELVARL